MDDGKIMLSRDGLHWRASFWWDGHKHTSNAWGTREQATAQAEQQLRSLRGLPRGAAVPATGLPTEPILVRGSTKDLTLATLRVLASSYGITGIKTLRREQLIEILTPILEGAACTTT